MSTQLANQLESARRDLLDLTARNRLLSTPLARERSTRLDIVDELSSEVFRILVQERREMTFLPTVNPETQTPSGDGNGTDGAVADTSRIHLPQPIEGEQPTSDRQTDRNLQTPLDSEKLQTRLLRLYYDAKAMFEEQGVNSLFLAMGFLEWYESPSSDRTRFAPLLLIPVELDRRTVNARFRVRMLEEEINTNLSLQAKLNVDFGLQLPDVPDVEELKADDYFASVERVIEKQPGWKVHRNQMTVWFFSFTKFLMFRDLDPEVWPEGKGPFDHPLVGGLLGESVCYEPPLLNDDAPLDIQLDPRSLCHVVDCDSSQAVAIEEVCAGRNLVIQGPPGTGKSQSIANIMASAVRDGRTVLFVAEKLAALQVVKSRLERIGLGDMCLELHSHKANRRSVLDDLDRTLNLGRPAGGSVEQTSAELASVRARLNLYVEQLHQPLKPVDRTAYELIGTLCRLQQQGTTAFNCHIPDIASWSSSDLRSKRSLLQDLAEHIADTGAPNEHPWRGVRCTRQILPTELTSLKERLERLSTHLGRIIEQSSILSDCLHIPWQPESESFQSVQQLAQLAEALRTIPEMDRAAYGNSVWEQQRSEIDRAIERGRELIEHRTALAGVVTPAAWQLNVAQVREDLAATGGRWLRCISRRWRRAIATFRGILEQPCPRDVQTQLKILDRLVAAQACLADLNEGGRFFSVGKSAFGNLWSGSESDWDRLRAITSWDRDCTSQGDPQSFRKTVAGWTRTDETLAAYVVLKDVFRQTQEGLRQMIKDLEIDLAETFLRPELIEVPLEELRHELSRWLNALPALRRWTLFQRRLRELHEAGLDSLRPQIDQGELNEQSLDRLELMYCEAAMRKVFDERDAIARFDGVSQSRLVEEFRRLDKLRIELARKEVAAAHFDRLPSGGDVGEVGIIRGEARKKRKHRALRRLLADAGHAVQAIKPVFMMSPTSVAQFLEPGILTFDLLVFDEASQVRPVEALGAILRARQLVVVGDNRQLPPTPFFDRVIEGVDEDEVEQEGIDAGDVESILDLCVSRNMPQRMLRWHYRSRHHSLIAVSNREFYDNGLFVVPSPERERPGVGLEFRFVENGIFDRGKSRTNRREARAVAQAMIDHARQFPTMSLGVGAFSVAQRDAILDELELLRRQHPETEEFFSQSRDEPWFVKNLENIQGDERDTIFISVGYGKDESGFFAMNFGPLNAKGGERRLNVLISRAKKRCVVFSSIRADEIDLRRTNARGAEALKSFLQYAESGRIEVSRPTDRGCDSEFETQVADALRDNGWEVDHQVGIAGFFIDLAVVDPAVPGRYLLGIECDGATYHSARWARDRDRLRQEVLEDHGWKLYRIWSTDWFHSPDEQLRKLLSTLEDLKLLSGSREASPQSKQAHGGDLEGGEDCCEILREARDPQSDDGRIGVPYQEVDFQLPVMQTALHEVTTSDLVPVVVTIVDDEGPIHGDEIARRVTRLWRLQRTGSRITKAVHRALRAAVHGGQIVETAGFYTIPGSSETPIRCRENVNSPTLRKPEMLPPQEIDAAILKFIEAHISSTPDETAREIARILGFRSTSQQLRCRIDSRVEFLVSEGRLCRDGAVLRVVPDCQTASGSSTNSVGTLRS